jgi:hypothetical protein
VQPRHPRSRRRVPLVRARRQGAACVDRNVGLIMLYVEGQEVNFEKRSKSHAVPVVPGRSHGVPGVLVVLLTCVSISTSSAADRPPASPDSIPAWIRPLSLQGTLEGELRWAENAGPRLASTPRSSLHLRRVELVAGGKISNWIDVLLVANAEYFGDLMSPGDGHLAVDEGHLDLQRDGFPLYLVLGKRTQPFGAFENHLITDPLTQDGYEVNRAGVTVGMSGPLGVDVSATGITGAEQIGHLLGSGQSRSRQGLRPAARLVPSGVLVKAC